MRFRLKKIGSKSKDILEAQIEGYLFVYMPLGNHIQCCNIYDPFLLGAYKLKVTSDFKDSNYIMTNKIIKYEEMYDHCICMTEDFIYSLHKLEN